MAVPVQPGEWKIREGLIPIPLKYPTIIGRKCLRPTVLYNLLTGSCTPVGISGVVQKVGPGVTRFKPGDRIMSNTSGVLRGDYRFGAYQKFCLVPVALTSKVWTILNTISRKLLLVSTLLTELRLARHLSKKLQISVLPMHPLARSSYI